MPELGTYGSVRGVSSNGHPYRDQEWLERVNELSGLAALSALYIGFAAPKLAYPTPPLYHYGGEP